MSDSRALMKQAADRVTVALDAVAEPDRNLPTPCSEFALGELVGHFLGTTTMLAGTGRRESPAEPPPVGDDWPQQLRSSIADLADAWSRPEAWQGEVSMGGGDSPAAMIGDMAFAEILLHGWDISRATGVELTIDDELAPQLRQVVEETAELGRTMGAYGDAVSVPDSASDVDQALAAAGRDPNWRP